jgi:hypothetical protein
VAAVRTSPAEMSHPVSNFIVRRSCNAFAPTALLRSFSRLEFHG